MIFVFYYIDKLYYSCHKVTLNCGRSHKDSPEWLKNKKAFIDPKTEYNKCFQNSAIIRLKYIEIPDYPERDKNTDKAINFPA